ncbi:hypothetical protein BJ165DRAFT_1426023 [Panaeolus papilionaceus]|nr:hypothetical protein BJ165DRAFT_1426023 [Panaeolus papilionaceus]
MQFLANIAAILLASVALLVTRTAAQVLCSPTGPGVCNLAFQGGVVSIGGSLGGPDQVLWLRMGIFNNSCRVIGNKSFPQEGDAVASELPYTIVINRLVPTGDYNWIKFCYAGTCYDGGFACARDGTTLTCRKAFNC